MMRGKFDRAGISWPSACRWVGIALLGLPLLTIGYMGLSARYLADDYCTAGTLRELGLLGSQRHWYVHWSGRYAFTLAVNLVELLGPSIAPLLPGLTIAIWLLALVITFRVKLTGRGRTAWSSAVLLGMSVLAGSLMGVPDLYQSLIWQTGLITYASPLVILSAHGAWLLYRWKRSRDTELRWFEAALATFVPFVSGGFSETIALTQVSGFALGLLACLVMDRREDRRRAAAWLAAGLLGSLLALLVIWAAPGNETRMALMPGRQGLHIVAWRSLRNAYLYARIAFEDHWMMSLVVLTIPILISAKHAGRSNATDGKAPAAALGLRGWLPVGGIPLAAFLLVVAVMFPSEFATASYPSGRVLITAEFIRNASLAIFGLHLGELLGGWRSRRIQAWEQGAWTLLLALILLSVSFGLRDLLAERDRLFRFARLWDERHASIQQMRAEGEMRLQIRSLPHLAGLGEVEADPDHWVNRCVAQFYDLGSVEAK